MTPNFTLDQFLKGDKHPPAEALPLVLALCENVLEPVREWAQCPVIITSGWRPPAQNKASGGAKTSQHQWSADAVACDFTFDCENPQQKLKDCHAWLYANQVAGCDQVILEWAGTPDNYRCVHVGWGGKRRGMYGYGSVGNKSSYTWLP